MIEQNGLTNAQVLPGDGAQELLEQRFDLIATNPPFHVGGIQTTEIAGRFIREAAKVMRLMKLMIDPMAPGGRCLNDVLIAGHAARIATRVNSWTGV